MLFRSQKVSTDLKFVDREKKTEKFWKAANSYYRSSKAWIPMKSVEKLEVAIHQTEEKKHFLEAIFSFHL